MGASVFGEGGLELGEGFFCDTVPDAVIRVDNNFLLLFGLGVDELDLDRDDFGLEVACFLEGDGS